MTMSHHLNDYCLQVHDLYLNVELHNCQCDARLCIYVCLVGFVRRKQTQIDLKTDMDSEEISIFQE